METELDPGGNLPLEVGESVPRTSYAHHIPKEDNAAPHLENGLAQENRKADNMSLLYQAEQDNRTSHGD